MIVIKKNILFILIFCISGCVPAPRYKAPTMSANSDHASKKVNKKSLKK